MQAERGILFNATYTVYDVQEVDSICLLRLRNPPGDHKEWSGDWGDRSPLWTAKLKLKFAYVDDPSDNSFYMSFDDFCNIFKSLYVCKWYNQHRWNETRHPGWWKCPTEYSEEEEDKTEEVCSVFGCWGRERTRRARSCFIIDMCVLFLFCRRS